MTITQSSGHSAPPAPEVGDDVPLGTYDDPARTRAVGAPVTTTDLLRGLVDEMSARGNDILDNLELRIRGVMAEAMGVAFDPADEAAPSLADLRAMAEEQDLPILVLAADTFQGHRDSFNAAIATMHAGIDRMAQSPLPETRHLGIVKHAIPEALRIDLDALRGAALLKLTGALDGPLERDIGQRRADGHAELRGKREGMFRHLMRDYQQGGLSVVVSTMTAWAEQGTITNGDSALIDTRSHASYASASFTIGDTPEPHTTLARY
ncbi:hypothetical protein HC022_10610 [Salipiger sp. HF18]|uniref:hypothetical protein n=1 Tax=Salipiger sp. HF18 TaxID=2721557 RepID=UPI00142DF23E|nr:hypothetical protein [Salipiger sp. HF18]NIY96676.1 hypothetical protein [Salipiger sp. HF18]